MFQPAALEVVLEFTLYIARQLPALLRQMGRECRVILVDDPIEKCLLGTVTLVTTSILVPTWGMIRVLALLCFSRVCASLRDREAFNP